jgi:hypothetical protein
MSPRTPVPKQIFGTASFVRPSFTFACMFIPGVTLLHRLRIESVGASMVRPDRAVKQSAAYRFLAVGTRFR